MSIIIPNQKMKTYYAYFQSPVGRLLMLAQQEKLVRLDFDQGLVPLNPDWICEPNLPLFCQVSQGLENYFAGKREIFSAIPLAPQGTAFQLAVWQALRHIEYGRWESYAALATRINNPKAVRAVGGAVGRNPLSIIIPCHRILGKDSALTGFGGGLPIKRYLLQLEGIAYKERGIEFVQSKLSNVYQKL